MGLCPVGELYEFEQYVVDFEANYLADDYSDYDY
jgi:hypothetical protein